MRRLRCWSAGSATTRRAGRPSRAPPRRSRNYWRRRWARADIGDCWTATPAESQQALATRRWLVDVADEVLGGRQRCEDGRRSGVGLGGIGLAHGAALVLALLAFANLLLAVQLGESGLLLGAGRHAGPSLRWSSGRDIGE